MSYRPVSDSLIKELNAAITAGLNALEQPDYLPEFTFHVRVNIDVPPDEATEISIQLEKLPDPIFKPEIAKFNTPEKLLEAVMDASAESSELTDQFILIRKWLSEVLEIPEADIPISGITSGDRSGNIYFPTLKLLNSIGRHENKDQLQSELREFLYPPLTAGEKSNSHTANLVYERLGSRLEKMGANSNNLRIVAEIEDEGKKYFYIQYKGEVPGVENSRSALGQALNLSAPIEFLFRPKEILAGRLPKEVDQAAFKTNNANGFVIEAEVLLKQLVISSAKDFSHLLVDRRDVSLSTPPGNGR